MVVREFGHAVWGGFDFADRCQSWVSVEASLRDARVDTLHRDRRSTRARSGCPESKVTVPEKSVKKLGRFADPIPSRFWQPTANPQQSIVSEVLPAQVRVSHAGRCRRMGNEESIGQHMDAPRDGPPESEVRAGIAGGGFLL